MKFIRISYLTILIFLIGCSSLRTINFHQGKYLGWDLTYRDLLKCNSISKDQFLWKWLSDESLYKIDGEKNKHYVSPINALIANWPESSIKSSVLLEQPAFHDGAHMTTWIVHSDNGIYLYAFFKGQFAIKKAPLDQNLYLEFFDKLFQLNQKNPISKKEYPNVMITGYAGILSLYNAGESRQILLNIDDIYKCKRPNCDSVQKGRVTKLIYEIISSSLPN